MRRVGIRVLGVLLVILASGCGGGAGAPTGPTPTPSQPVVQPMQILVPPLQVQNVEPNGNWHGHCGRPSERSGVLKGDMYSYRPDSSTVEILLIPAANAPTCYGKTQGACNGELARNSGSGGFVSVSAPAGPGEYCIFVRTLSGSQAVQQGMVSLNAEYSK
jgi:hypothetical protein